MHDIYTKNHLYNYIKFQLHNHYGMADIINALEQYGYDRSIIDDVVHEIGDEHVSAKQSKSKTNKNLKRLNRDLLNYTQEMLIDYVVKQLKQGYHEAAIRRALLRIGHHEDLINNAFAAIQGGKVKAFIEPKSGKFSDGVVFSIALLLLLVGAFVLSVGVNETIFVVLMTLVPTLISLGIAFFMLVSIRIKFLVRVLPVLSILFTVGIFAYLLNYSVVYLNKDITILFALNIVLTVVLTGFMVLFRKEEFSPAPQPKVIDDHEQITEDDLVEARAFRDEISKRVKQNVSQQQDQDSFHGAADVQMTKMPSQTRAQNHQGRRGSSSRLKLKEFGGHFKDDLDK